MRVPAAAAERSIGETPQTKAAAVPVVTEALAVAVYSSEIQTAEDAGEIYLLAGFAFLPKLPQVASEVERIGLPARFVLLPKLPPVAAAAHVAMR